MSERQYVTFGVAGQFFGVDVATVQEVLRFHEYTPVPLSEPAINGLFNLRGQVITAIDLRVPLGLPPRQAGGSAMNVVVRVNGEPVSLLVDHIGEVIDLDDAAAEPPPDTLTGRARDLVKATFKLDGRLLLVLDVQRATAASSGAITS
jgi:purine-binding chemotaxis protein CheW